MEFGTRGKSLRRLQEQVRSTAVPGALLDETQARHSVAMPGE
jgi:hypothetical protein